jgi:hypothetical protein
MGDRQLALVFLEAYGRTWQDWDHAGFVALSADGVVYHAHPTDETVVGRAALESYVAKESEQHGVVHVHMGLPVIDGDRVAAEFWWAALTSRARRSPDA